MTKQKSEKLKHTLWEGARIKLRINIKKILRKYDYLSNMIELVADNILKQTRIVAKEITER